MAPEGKDVDLTKSGNLGIWDFQNFRTAQLDSKRQHWNVDKDLAVLIHLNVYNDLRTLYADVHIVVVFVGAFWRCMKLSLSFQSTANELIEICYFTATYSYLFPKQNSLSDQRDV